MKSIGYGMEYASARATPELVGRKEILGIIKKAIEKKAKKTQVVYITARGGMGKTRLLEEVVKFWNKQIRVQKKTKILVVGQLVDLYHTHTHNLEGLIDEIVESLGEKHFKKYLEKRATLIHMKYEKGETPSDASKQEMIEVFIAELNELGQKYDKVVLVFDTAEVLRFQKNPSQNTLGPTDSLTTIARWLTQGLISRLQNVTVLIAGRPPKTSMSDQLLDQLNKTGAKITPYQLPSFNLEETLEYFNVMAKATRKENPQSAKRIQSIPEEIRRVIHDLTQGEPFVLALLIDYVAITDELPSLGQRKPDEFRKELRNRIIEAIQKCLRPSDEVIEALSWTPKGMGYQLLAWVLQHHEPNNDEMENAKKSIDELRKPKKRLSFVKIRASDDLVFFQDEMYSLMEDIHRSEGMKSQKERIDEYILDFYEWKIKETRGKIQKREMELDATRHTPEEMSKLSPAGIVREEEKLSKARARLQAYQVEHVYYTLRVNPSEGFKLYLEYAEEAFQSGDENLWLLLQDELLQYAYEFLPVEGLTWEDIEAHMGIRWIRSSLARDEYDEAERRIGVFRKTVARNLLKPGSYMDLELKIWEIGVLAYTGRNSERARDLLNEVLDNIERLPSETNLNKWRINFLKAYALYWHGYLSRMQGDFGQATKWYLKSVPLWRELKFEVMAGLTLNDLSWAEAEEGDFDIALSHCKDALKLRSQLGNPRPIALSLNTMGLIEIRSGKPETARFHCEQALEIFRRLENARGIGLACLALAEALRRTTNTDLFVYAERRKIEYLTRAAELAEEGVKVFTEKVKEEPLRLAEAYIELGCVYREWIRSLPKEHPERSMLIERSRVAYEKAAKVAREAGYEYRAIDALVNMAWLYYYVNDLEKAREILKKDVRNYIGDQYLFTIEHGVVREALNPWHWVQLGKANVLLGAMFFDEYLKAPKDSPLAKQKLQQAAHNWTLSMAYNTLYSKDFRDYKKGREDIYKRLSTLNSQEMKWVRESMERTHNEYHISNEQKVFEQQLLKKLLQE